jgi:hypothetical protein
MARSRKSLYSVRQQCCIWCCPKEKPSNFPRNSRENSDPDGIRTRVAGVKGLCPRPLDDGAPRSQDYNRHRPTASRRAVILSGGGGNRTRVPRHLRDGLYVCSRIIYAFAAKTPNRRGETAASRQQCLIPSVADATRDDPELRPAVGPLRRRSSAGAAYL